MDPQATKSGELHLHFDRRQKREHEAEYKMRMYYLQ